MALVLKDRVRETTTVLGTNDATLLGAVTGFQSFAVVGSANTCYYCIADQSGGNWEVGIGTYSSVGPTLARTTILSSSNSGSIVSFPAGTKDVFLTYPSEKAVFEDASGNVSLPADLTVVGAVNAGSINATTIDLTNIEVTNIKAKDGTQSIALADSTGVATFSANPVISSGTANGVVYLNGSKSATSGNSLYFDGANLGIGTSSPVSKLHVNGSGSTLTLSTTGNNNNGLCVGVDTDGSGVIATYAGQGAIKFGGGINTGSFTGERMRLDSSGNLGLGVTPSAWSSVAAIQLKSGSIYGVTGAETGLSSNAYYDGAWKYIANNPASQYLQSNSNHYWFNASSGTAGNAITFTSVMQLNSSGNLGIGINPQAGIRIAASDGTVNVAVGYPNSTVAYAGTLSNHNYTFITNNVGRMTVTTDGTVGIGTTSPQQTLHVVGNTYVPITKSYFCYATDFGMGTPDSTGLQIFTGAGDVIRFGHRASGTFTEDMRIDSLGNIGLGSTPNVWPSAWTAMQISGTTSLASSSATSTLGQNWYLNSSSVDTYINTAAATVFRQASGYYSWFTAPSGTSGAAMALTEVMTLRNDGNLGIGNTNPAYKLDVGISSGPYSGRFYNTSTSTSQYNVVLFGQAASGSATGYIGTGGSAAPNTSFANNFVIGTQSASSLVFNTNDTARMRITSGGNVGIGTSSPGYLLDVNGVVNCNGIQSYNSSLTFTGQGKWMAQYEGSSISRMYFCGEGSTYGAMQIYSAQSTGSPSTTATFNQYGMGVGAGIPSSGTGIAFPAAQNPSSNANTLDDYEEGTWSYGSLAWLSGGTAPTPSAIENFTYTKIGRVVTLTGYIGIGSPGSGNGLQITGLPFASNGNYNMYAFWSANGTISLTGYMTGGSTTLTFGAAGASSQGTNNTNLPNEISVQMTYITST